MRKLVSNLLGRLKRKIDRFGYPIVQLTAPKGVIEFKVNRQDPAFFKPLSELKPKNHIIEV
jgi:hypothetical protein